MIKESRVLVRLIALWIIFILSLGLTLWSAQQFILSAVKMATGGYSNYYANNSYNYCLQQPIYPSYQGAPVSGDPTADKANADKYVKDTEKYNQDMEKYNADAAKLCNADKKKQDDSQRNQEKSAERGEVASFGILLVLGVILSVVSLIIRRKSEKE